MSFISPTEMKAGSIGIYDAFGMRFTNQGVSFWGWQFCSYQTHTVVLMADPRNQDTPRGGLQ